MRKITAHDPQWSHGKTYTDRNGEENRLPICTWGKTQPTPHRYSQQPLIRGRQQPNSQRKTTETFHRSTMGKGDGLSTWMGGKCIHGPAILWKKGERTPIQGIMNPFISPPHEEWTSHEQREWIEWLVSQIASEETTPSPCMWLNKLVESARGQPSTHHYPALTAFN